MYDEKDLQKLIADVTTEFTAHLAKAEKSFSLAKSEEESEKKEKTAEEGSESKKPVEEEKPEDKGVKDQHQQDTSKEAPKGDKMESKEGREESDEKENSKPSDDPHGEAMDHGYDDEDMAHMHSMYSSMSKPELKAHHDAVRKCMDGMSKTDGMDGGMAMSESMHKSEKDSSVSEISLLKSELETAKATSEGHKKNLDAVSAFLAKFVEKMVPQGKAITELGIIAKNSEPNEKPLNKSEIDAKLMAKAKESTLAKSDRDAINSYYFSKNIETVRHLLK